MAGGKAWTLLGPWQGPSLDNKVLKRMTYCMWMLDCSHNVSGSLDDIWIHSFIEASCATSMDHGHSKAFILGLDVKTLGRF